MGQTSDEIAAGIARHREDLGRDLEVLEQRLMDVTDLRTHFRKHTGAFLLVSLAVGALMATAIGRR